ncbi:RHS repeat-associated core domain-containing protein [Leptospira vanthielii]|uniref:RHS repeat-associated core domain-containing protein n=1 Tax=Leptospira vanthielii TaxID=293085 RepID=A0ABY2NP46_9LEPT|nr:RHS repeat-associated core domain-containing protein [Leptospira vanthielii]TGM56890.1 RHS repeat-associated core domain-containing protein [Leptospira vanthielii]
MFGTRPTLYVIGAEGDMVAQYSRGDAILLNQMASNDWLVNPFCKDVNIDCDTYWKNRVGFFFIKTLEDTNVYVDGKLREGHRALPWVALLGFLFWVVYQTKDQTEDANVENQTVDLFGISLLPSFTNRIQKQIPRYGTALLVVMFSFTTTAGCFPLLLGGGEAESGTPIWLLGLGNGIPADTQSVADEPGQGGSGGGGTSTGNARVEGMYFFHPDHLGSITMITDGHGNVLAGGERGGKSHITYKPYGEIFRTDSYGPDITKFKYTGQEEDQESGLYYYKARYYDASLGRFVSNDGVTMPSSMQGLNRMMYVDGNPISFRDRTGNSRANNFLQDMAKFVIAEVASKSDNPVHKFMAEVAGQKALYKIRKHRGSAFMRSDLGKISNTVNPLNLTGATYAAMNYAAGKIMQRDTKLKKVNGGYVVQGGPLANGGITIGQFAVTSGTDEESLRHETAHLQQYREWGEYKYLGNLASSPIRNKLNYPDLESENDADRRAGTFGYGAGNKKVVNMILLNSSNAVKGIGIDKYGERLIQMFVITEVLGYMP